MKIGRMAEDLACGYLERNGHKVVARNWRSGHLEVDIVSTDASGIHFVEVKSRVAPVQAGPEENVGYRKQKRLAEPICIRRRTNRFWCRRRFFSTCLV